MPLRAPSTPPRHTAAIKRRASRTAPSWIAGAAALLACGTAPEETTLAPTEPPVSSAPTWSGAIRAVVADHCATCHVPGGIGPFPLHTYAAAAAVAPAALAAIEAGRMPPWMPSADCRTYLDDRRMPAAAIEAFRAWVEAGTPEGAPTEPLEAPASGARPTPDIVASPSGPYTPAPLSGNPDDYRCFLLDHAFDEDTYLAEGWVQPGVEPIVHHVLLYAIGPEDAAAAAAREGADGQPGFDCFGAMTGGPVGWWVPGAVPQRYPGRAAKVFPAGSRLLMQIHYNVLAAPPAPDLTTFNLVTRPAPERAALTVGLAHPAIAIQPGDPNSVQVREFRNTGREDWVISEVMGHMHLLGTRMRIEAVRADGETDCLLDIPRWDFDWQQMYRLPESEPFTVAPGDALRLTCVYDNTLANQPVIDGVRAEPSLVTWGESSLDEMCLAYVTREAPLPDTSPVADACRGLGQCRATCDAPDTYRCVLSCSFRRATCGDCLIEEMFSGGCGSQVCGGEASAATACYGQCRREAASDLVACMAARCPAEIAALDACMTPVVATGGCEGAFTLCGG